MKQFTLLSIILSFLSCSINNNEALATENTTNSITPRIVGAEDADIEYFPYTVSLRLRGRYFCTACSIGHFDLLASAHCFTHMDTAVWPYLDVTIHMDTSSSIETGSMYWLRKVTIHPGWTGTYETSMNHDLAHIRLDSAIVSEYQQFANLPIQNVISMTKGYVTGWGSTIPRGRNIPEKLQMLKMRILSPADCQRHMPITIYPEQLCAYKKKGCGCTKGDSGAPLISNNYLVGLHSWVARDYCATGKPEIFSNIFAEMDFVNRAIMIAET